ncbi:MAG TPA: META domain-containing protein [Methanoregulaceae archaeon]|nr:META domain-containing protein [Methanoregulaceae archaeon]
MNSNAAILLIGALIVTVLVVGCTTPLPQTVPVTPLPTTAMPMITPKEPTLTGTWTLASILAQGRGTSMVPLATITTTFSDTGLVSGSAGCNNYVATYQVSGDRIAVGKPAVAKNECSSPIGVSDQETIYLSNLKAAERFTIDNDRLTFYDLTGTILLIYDRAESQESSLPITGIPWILELYRMESGANMPANLDTEVTALFGTDGTLSGSAGCNAYNGSYTPGGATTISIGDPIVVTERYCGGYGVMEQEEAYLALLPSVAFYEVTSDGILYLRDESFTPLIRYTS